MELYEVAPIQPYLTYEYGNSIRFKLTASGRTRIHSIWLILEQIFTNIAQTLLGDLSVLASIILPYKYLFTCLFPLLDYELIENRNLPSLVSETPHYPLIYPIAWSFFLIYINLFI